MTEPCASCAVAARQAKSTGCLATCSECGAEFVPPLHLSEEYLSRPLEDHEMDAFDAFMRISPIRPTEREYPVVPPEQCAECQKPPASTIEALLRDLSRAARWHSLASPRATSLEPRAPGSTSGGSAPVESAVTLAHGRHTLDRLRAIAAREGGAVESALWWMLDRAPQLELSPGDLPGTIAWALGTAEQKKAWRPAPPPTSPEAIAALNLTPGDVEDLKKRYRKAKEGGFLGGTIWGRELLARVLEAWGET